MLGTQEAVIGAQAPVAWHALDPAEALGLAGSAPGGLSDAEAAARLAGEGPNTLPEPVGATVLGVVLRQFASPVVYLLLGAGALSLLLRNWGDAAFIFLVVAVDAAVGAVQEWRAESSAASLRKTLRVRPTVLRGGHRVTVDLEDVVRGDIVLLEPGGAVPADLRLLSTHDLMIDESLLTGESDPVHKDAKVTAAADAAVGDRGDMAFAGTVVTVGRGSGVVCAVGAGTELGRIASALSIAGAPPPLLLRMEAFTRRFMWAAIVLLPLLGLAQFLRGESFADVLVFSIAVGVAAIPEGLPVAVTIALAVAATRMARRKVIVRRLPAVEALGSCTLIASDKTGTLTVNRLTVKAAVLADGTRLDIGGEGLSIDGAIRGPDGSPAGDEARERLRALATAAAISNEAGLRRIDGAVEASGDTVDVALLVLAAKLGLERQHLMRREPLVSAIHYEPADGFSAALAGAAAGRAIYVKGAPEVILAMCDGDSGPGLEQTHRLAAEGYRVIAVARGKAGRGIRELRRGDLKRLEFLGLVGLVDPLRPGAAEAVERCRSAGIDVRMITGDHPETALALARRLDPAIRDDQVATGRDLAALQDAPLQDRILASRVFARVDPTQKTVIVKALQAGGHFVAVTGDGVNDAPALQAAHVGVAMGASGTDVARASADLIIGDDDFSSIVAGVEEGRAAYDNIRKIVWLLVSTAIAEMVLFGLSLALGLPMPLTAVQILWVNLVTEGLQDVALALEAREPGAMKRPPRPPRQPIFDRAMIEQCLLSGGYVGLLACLIYWVLVTGLGYDEFAARNLLLLFLVCFENAQTLACRSETRSALRIPFRANPLLIAAVAGSQALHIAAMYTPGLRDVLGVQPVGVVEWLALVLLGASVLGVSEIYKQFRARPAAALAAA